MKPKWQILLVILAALAGWYLYATREPLKKYGVYYESVPTQSGTYTILDFYRKKGNQIIRGPAVYGSLLKVSYKNVDQDNVPEIVITSIGGEESIFRLNLTDENRPDFEVLEDGHTISYRALGYNYP